MLINDLLKDRSLTKYKLSKMSGVPFATISDITTGKARIEKCAADTLFKLAKALDVTMEDLISDRMEHRPSFEAFKSTICHRVRDMGDIDFIIHTLESGEIRRLFEKKWYPESLYLLAMVDYLSRENGLPLCADYQNIRAAKFQKPLYPAGVLTLCAALQSDAPKMESIKAAIPEFMRFNIVEGEVRNVC